MAWHSLWLSSQRHCFVRKEGPRPGGVALYGPQTLRHRSAEPLPCTASWRAWLDAEQQSVESEQEHRIIADRSVNCFWRKEDRTAGTGPASVVLVFPGRSLDVLFVPRHEQTVAMKGLDWESSGRSIPDRKASGKPCSGPRSPGRGAFPSLRLSWGPCSVPVSGTRHSSQLCVGRVPCVSAGF